MWSRQELIDKQARFWVLMAGGSTLTAASETVGVSRATGRKWRPVVGSRGDARNRRAGRYRLELPAGRLSPVWLCEGLARRAPVAHR